MKNCNWKSSIALFLTGLFLLVTVYLGVTFHIRSNDVHSVADPPRTAVVFTGQFDRVRLGLLLIEQDVVDTLFISGVNPEAGFFSANLSDQFNLSEKQRELLNTGKIILAPHARFTIENAWESACWLEKNPEVRSLLLITSKTHMPRASLALDMVLPNDITVDRQGIQSPFGETDMNMTIEEFFKYVITFFFLIVSEWSPIGNSLFQCDESLF